MSPPDETPLPAADSLPQVLGALVFGADHPLTVEDLLACLRDVGAADPRAKPFAEATAQDVREALDGLARDLSRLGLGIELAEVGGAFRFQSQAAAGRWLRHLLKVDRPNRLSRPALETLAIIAYRQPIAKAEIEAVRGVTVDHIIHALMELHLVRIVGRSELPGRPFLYGTTAAFLEHFGLRNLNELNALDPTLQRANPSEQRAAHCRAKTSRPARETASAPRDAAARELVVPPAPPPDAEPVHEPPDAARPA